jgi:hypothetical protein
MRPELADLRRDGIAIVISNVTLDDLGYNTSDKQNPKSPKEV